MPQEFTIRSSPTYRSLDAVLPSAAALRTQQQDLTTRRGQVLRAIGEELRNAMAQGLDAVVLQMTPGWRERALEQAGYEVTPAPAHMGADRFVIYFGDRDAADKASYLATLERPDGAPAVIPSSRYAAPSPPSPSIYARTVFENPSPPPVAAPPLAPAPVRPPFDRGHTVPGPEYQSVPRRPERGVAFDQDVRAGAYTPRPGGRF